MQATLRERLEFLQKYETTPKELPARAVKLIVHSYLTPKLTFSDICVYMGTNNLKSVRKLINGLVDDGYLKTNGKPYWNTHIHAFKIITVYNTTPKAELFLSRLAQGIFD